jgi:ABC-type transport system involved in cytochrome c biogenesis permease subunit
MFMDQQFIRDEILRGRQSTAVLYWSGLLFATMVAIGVVEYVETDILVSAISLGQLHVFKAAGYANLFLAASSVLYLCDFVMPSKGIGKWASWVAGIGAAGAVLALFVRWVETYVLHRPGHLPLNVLYEAMAFFIAATVVSYLVMEHVYRSRAAGPFVMLIVLGAIGYQGWLAATGQALEGIRIPVVRGYWIYAQVLGIFVGYGAFAAAAALGAACLLRSGGSKTCAREDFEGISRFMHCAMLAGFPVFTLAAALGLLWGHETGGNYRAWQTKEAWSFVAWCIYASYFYFRNVRHWRSYGMAWWSIVGFAGAMACLLGVHVLGPGLHEYG